MDSVFRQKRESKPALGVVRVVCRGVGQGKIDVSFEVIIKLVLVEQARQKLGREGEKESLQRSGKRETHTPPSVEQRRPDVVHFL